MKTRIPASHPALPGHFPGQPVVPGVVLLDLVQAALCETIRGARITGLPSVKFLAPLRPEEDVEITVSPKSPGNAGFDICRDKLPIVTGSLRYETG
ncbi:MAG TPA: hypothetical protein VJ396_02495 [Acidiferrobacterales bacterium]|nr:hypothetical protein [Acidiferrobacterales bacterium]